MANSPQYLPPQLVSELDMEMIRRVREDVELDDPDGRWRFERLMERAYASGYSDGHMRGYQAGYSSASRRAQIDADNAAKSDTAEVSV